MNDAYLMYVYYVSFFTTIRSYEMIDEFLSKEEYNKSCLESLEKRFPCKNQ